MSLQGLTNERLQKASGPAKGARAHVDRVSRNSSLAAIRSFGTDSRLIANDWLRAVVQPAGGQLTLPARRPDGQWELGKENTTHSPGPARDRA